MKLHSFKRSFMNDSSKTSKDLVKERTTSTSSQKKRRIIMHSNRLHTEKVEKRRTTEIST